MPGGKRPGAGRKPGIPNKVTRELKEIAQAYAPAAIETAYRIMKAEKAPPAARLTAVGIILDRAYGKPAQAITHSGSVGAYDAAKLSAMTDAELKQFEELLSRIAHGPSAVGGDTGGAGEA